MKLAITPSAVEYALILFDTDTEKTLKIESDQRGFDHTPTTPWRPPHRPFGITWDSDNIFIASRSNLLIYNSLMELVDVKHGILDSNTHQIVYYENKLIVAMTRSNKIKIINLENYSSTSVSFGDRGIHINSVLVVEGKLYAMFNNKGNRNSELVEINMDTWKIECGTELPVRAAHGIYINGETVGTLNTQGNNLHMGMEVISNPIWNTMFLRGMAGDHKDLVVGGSTAMAVRQWRIEGPSFISVLEYGECKKVCRIEGMGAINDIRRIDGQDFCHYNSYEFPYQW